MPNLVADARALSAGQYGHLVVYGSTVAGDGGGGFYIWNAASTASDDGADWLKPDSITHPAPGRWQRVWSSVQAATTAMAGTVILGTNGETTAGEAVQCSDTRLHPATTLAGTPAYITLDGATQVITRALVDLASHVTGTLPILNGGTGAGTAGAAFDALKQLATETTTGVVELATSAETTAGLAVQASDTRIHPPASLAGTPNYVTIDAATQVITRALIDLTTHVTGLLPIANGGTGAGTAANAFAAIKQAASETATGVVELATSAETTAGLAVQASDTRIHAPVTLAGAPAYLTLSGQQITRVLIDLASHVTGNLPVANLGSGTGAAATTALHGDMTWKVPGERTLATETATTRANTANDRYQYVKFTNTGAKTPAVAGNVAAAGHAWVWSNMAATGNMVLSNGASMTLTGNLTFEPYRAATIFFTSATTADVIGGTA